MITKITKSIDSLIRKLDIVKKISELADRLVETTQTTEQKIFSKIENIKKILGFPGGAVVENLPANAGDTGSSPGLGRSHMPWSN